MKKIILVLIILFSLNSAIAQQTDIKATHDAMIAYFLKIAEVGMGNPPYQNAVSGFYRNAIAEDGKSDDGAKNPGGHPPAGPVTNLANVTLTLTDPSARQLFDVFKRFSTMNQAAFLNHINHEVNRYAAASIFGYVQQDWPALVYLGQSIAQLFVTDGSDLTAWANFANALNGLGGGLKDRSSLGGGDNAANGHISTDVNAAAQSALTLLNQYNFTPGTIEDKTKVILTTCFNNIGAMTAEYNNRHINWLNPGWQLTYTGIMKATGTALQNLYRSSNIKIATEDKPIDLIPKTFSKKLISIYSVSKIKNGKEIGKFIYYIDTTEIQAPYNYNVAFNNISDAKLFNSNRTALINMSSISISEVQPISNNSFERDINIQVSKRTYRKLAKIYKKTGKDWAIKKEEKSH